MRTFILARVHVPVLADCLYGENPAYLGDIYQPVLSMMILFDENGCIIIMKKTLLQIRDKTNINILFKRFVHLASVLALVLMDHCNNLLICSEHARRL